MSVADPSVSPALPGPDAQACGNFPVNPTRVAGRGVVMEKGRKSRLRSHSPAKFEAGIL